MDVLLDGIRQRPSGSLEDLAAVVRATVHDDISVAGFRTSPEVVFETLSSSTLLGQHCVYQKEHFMKVILGLVNGLSESACVEDVELLLRKLPWVSTVFGQLIVLLCWEDASAEPPLRALSQLSSLLQHNTSPSSPVLKAISSACSVLKAQLSVVEELQPRPQGEEFSSSKNEVFEVFEFGEFFRKSFGDLRETSVLPAVLNFSRLEFLNLEKIRSLSVFFSFSSSNEEIPTRKTVRFFSENENENSENENTTKNNSTKNNSTKNEFIKNEFIKNNSTKNEFIKNNSTKNEFIKNNLNENSTKNNLNENNLLTKRWTKNSLIENQSTDDVSRNRDVAVFTGYSVLITLMSAIFRDAVSRKMSASSKRSSRHSLHRETSIPEDTTDNEIAEAENLLKTLQPIEFRVEILENIFSLLFLRSSDLEEGHFPLDLEGLEGTDTDTNSVKSWSVAEKKIRDGFSSSSEKLVQKILLLLKNVVINTLSGRSKDVGSNLVEGSQSMGSNVVEGVFLTSVKKEEVYGRLGRLQQRLTDASWRLDVVTFPKDVPMSLNSAYAEDLARPSFLTRKLDAKKSSRRRRRKRRASTILKKHMDTSIIEKMLASPASLLRICLHRGTFNLADQVLKIFCLEDAAWHQEISFGESFQESVLFFSSNKKNDPKTKRKNSFEILPGLPISPYDALTDDHISVLIATDLAVLEAHSGSSSDVRAVTRAVQAVTQAVTQAVPQTATQTVPHTTIQAVTRTVTQTVQAATQAVTQTVQAVTQAVEKSSTIRFPTTKSMNLPEMRAFEDFIKINLNLSVSLKQKLPFLQAVPFHPVAAQSVAALLAEIGQRMKKLQIILNEPTRSTSSVSSVGSTSSVGSVSSGTALVKQLLKIFRSNLPPTGLLTLLNEQTVNPQASRVNYLLAMLTFLKNYAVCLKLEPEADNFDLLYQSCYGHLLGMFRTKRPTNEIDAFIKNLSLDVAQMLLNTTGKKSLPKEGRDFSHSTGIVVLNDPTGPAPGPRTTPNPLKPPQIVSSVLVRLLKIFAESRASVYSPQDVSQSALFAVLSDLSDLSDLQQTDCLDVSLQTDEERSTFFINLYNLLFIHSFLHVKFFEFGEKKNLNLNLKNSENEIFQRLHFWRYRYRVAPWGLISLQDLYDDLSPFSHLNSKEFSRFSVSKRKKNGFLMANFDLLIDVKVFHSEIFQQQTDLSVREYFTRTVWYEKRKKIVHLPTWLFRIYPSDKLMELVKTAWHRAKEVHFDEAILEPSGRLIRDAGIRRETSLDDKIPKISSPKRPVSAEAEDNLDRLRPDNLHSEETELPLDDLLPYLASPCSHLFDLLSFNGVTKHLLPSVDSSRSLLKLLFASHNGLISVDLLSEVVSEKISRGGDPLSILSSPLIRFAVGKSEFLKLFLDVTFALCVEKKLVGSPWSVAVRIRDRDLRMRTVAMVWRKWPLSACVEFSDLVVGEDQRPDVLNMNIRVKNLKTLIQVLHSDTTAWSEVFQQWNLDTVMNQMSVQEVEKRLEGQFRAFSATMLRMDQIEPLNAWLRHSEMPSLSVYQDDLQLRGLVHMLDSRPPMILSAYQLLIPMLEVCSFSRILDLLDAITTPEGRIPVIRITLMGGRFNEIEINQLKNKEVENLILRVLPESLRKNVSHLKNHPMLVLEQLILWNKLSYFGDILKIQGLFDVLSRRIFEDMVVEYAKKTVEVLVPSNETLQTKTTSDGSESSGRKAAPETPRKFYMPVAAPSKKEWTIDSTVSNCMVCGEKFGIVSSLFESVGLPSFNRKHHCRRCGRVVCVSCSAQTIQVDIYGDNPVRACDDCFEQTISMGSSMRSSKSSGITFKSPTPYNHSPTSTPTSSHLSTPNHPSALARSTSLRFVRERVERVVSPVGSSNSSDQQWVFTTDEATNQRLRAEFAFSEAPDAALCIGLLKLHSSPLVAGRELLKIGNELSEWIGSHNDCGLEHVTLVNIMRTLFFSAKIFLHEDKDNLDWIQVCDTYLNQLQLVELLLDAGAAEIPSVQQLAEIDTIRRVRDQLVQQERYALAVELSTKAGIDPGHVWLSWGRCLLRVGKFAEAQEKLSKCLKVPVDKSQASPPSAAALEDIMEVIQDARMPRRRGTLGADSVVNIVTKGDVLKADVVDASVAEHESFRKMTECLHYQEMYGTHSTLLKFFVKRGLTQKALEYCLRENVSVETFMDTMVIPSLRSGQLTAFEDELLMSDPTLNKWADYLIGICKQLTKRNMNQVLLSFQLFIKDYVRAATTCVMFFQSGPLSSYQEYFDKNYHLEEAQRHLVQYLEQQTILATDAVNRIRLTMSPEEVRKYIKTIKLQIQITQLLATKPHPEERRISLSSGLPTLFGNTQAKTDLIAMLLELHNTPKVDDCVLSVIDNHGLNPEDVLTKVAPLVSKDGLKGILGVLLTMKKQKTLTDFAYDALVIRMIVQCGAPAVALASKEWDVFIKQMSSDEKKVDAFIKAKKLRSAYLLAVQMQRADLVTLVGSEAQTSGDSAVQNLCARWLETKSRK